MQPIPHPNDASDKIWLRSTHCSQRYSCLKVWTHRQTDGRTDARTPARPIYYKNTSFKEVKQNLQPTLVWVNFICKGIDAFRYYQDLLQAKNNNLKNMKKMTTKTNLYCTPW